jgi:hypothetical protein
LVQSFITQFRPYNQQASPEFPGSRRSFMEDNHINNQISNPQNKIPFNNNVPQKHIIESDNEDPGARFYDPPMFSHEPGLEQPISRTRTRTRTPMISQSFQGPMQNYMQTDPNMSTDYFNIQPKISPRGTVYQQPQFSNLEPDYYENSTLNQSMDLMKMASIINAQNRSFSEPDYDQNDQYNQHNQMPYNVC